jgi:hypothetical protein
MSSHSYSPISFNAMNTRRRFLLGAVRGLMAIAVLACLGAIAASAQPLAWDPPCGKLSVVNYAPCPALLKLVTTPAGVIGPIGVPAAGPGGPGLAGPVLVPLGTAINGMMTPGGTTYPMVQPAPVPPPPAPPPAAPNGWIPTVTVDPTLPPGCCVDIYFDLASCTVYIFPTAFPCRV